MKKLLVVSAVACTFAAGTVAQAATEQEALKCGVAVHKFLSKLVTSIAKAPPKLCKNPGDLSEVAGKIVDKTLKAITKLNEKYTDEVCDPDLASFLPFDPADVTQAIIEGALQGSQFGGQNPPDTFCDNIMTP